MKAGIANSWLLSVVFAIFLMAVFLLCCAMGYWTILGIGWLVAHHLTIYCAILGCIFGFLTCLIRYKFMDEDDWEP